MTGLDIRIIIYSNLAKLLNIFLLNNILIFSHFYIFLVVYKYIAFLQVYLDSCPWYFNKTKNIILILIFL